MIRPEALIPLLDDTLCRRCLHNRTVWGLNSVWCAWSTHVLFYVYYYDSSCCILFISITINIPITLVNYIMLVYLFFLNNKYIYIYTHYIIFIILYYIMSCYMILYYIILHYIMLCYYISVFLLLWLLYYDRGLRSGSGGPRRRRARSSTRPWFLFCAVSFLSNVGKYCKRACKSKNMLDI